MRKGGGRGERKGERERWKEYNGIVEESNSVTFRISSVGGSGRYSHYTSEARGYKNEMHP